MCAIITTAVSNKGKEPKMTKNEAKSMKPLMGMTLQRIIASTGAIMTAQMMGITSR
jgi:hypothetical protein